LSSEQSRRPSEICDVATNGLLHFLGPSSLSAPSPYLSHLSRTKAIQIFLDGVSIDGAS
jgi:hypothetical protein